jgi:hypothetical protein
VLLNGVVANSGTIVAANAGDGGAGGYGKHSFLYAPGGNGGNGGVGGDGIDVLGIGTVINSGTIEAGIGGQGGTAGMGTDGAPNGTNGAAGANGDGVVLSAGSQLTNGSGGVIEGAIGVYAKGGNTTVTNSATISGTANSVKFTAATDTLIAESGAQFAGAIAGGGGTLQVTGGTGSISGLGGAGTLAGSDSGSFAGFGSYVMGPTGAWTLTGTNVLSAGQSLVDQAKLTVTGSLSEAANATISVAKGASISFSNGGGGVFGGAIFGAGAASLVFLKGADTFNGTFIEGAKITLNGANVTLLGTISDTKTVSVSDKSVVVGAGGATLTGGGWVFTDNATNRITGAAASDTLTLDSTVLSGAGQVGGGNMTLVIGNDAGVWATGTQAMVIDTGGNLIKNAGTIQERGTGGLTVKSAVENDGGEFMVDKGTLTVLGAVSGTGGALITSGTLVFGSTFNQEVSFAGTTGELVLAQSQGYTATIFGFSKSGGTSLDLRDIGFVSSAEATWSSATGVLTVTDGTHTAHITLAGDFSGSTFTCASDGQGGVLVTDPPAALLRQSVAAGFQSGGGVGAETFHAAIEPVHAQLAGTVG